MSRDQILENVLKNQPEKVDLPADLSFKIVERNAMVNKFVEVIEQIGGQVIHVKSFNDIENYIHQNYHAGQIKVIKVDGLEGVHVFTDSENPHEFEHTAFAIFKSELAVAENGAVWLTELQMGHRVIPFITQHLAMVVETESIVANMHDAYEIISSADYGFGTFIAGPSKTADIEQSLVLGAHGARTATIFLMA